MARAKRTKCAGSGSAAEIPGDDWLRKKTRCPVCRKVVGFYPQYQGEASPGKIAAKLRDHTR